MKFETLAIGGCLVACRLFLMLPVRHTDCPGPRSGRVHNNDDENDDVLCLVPAFVLQYDGEFMDLNGVRDKVRETNAPPFH